MSILPKEEAKRMILSRVARWKRDREARERMGRKPADGIAKAREPLPEGIQKAMPNEAARSLSELRGLLEDGNSFTKEERIIGGTTPIAHKAIQDVPTERAFKAMSRFQGLALHLKESYTDNPEVLKELSAILKGYVRSDLYRKIEEYNGNPFIYTRLLEEIRQKLE